MNLTISINHPCLFIIAVAKDRLPVFQTEAIKAVTCAALDEAGTSGGFLLFSYLNPVRAELVERAVDYKWSSVRFWNRCPSEDEPLRVDIDKIVWRRS